jgi:hypothetical protein
LDYASTTALVTGSGTIRDAALNDATLTLASPGAANSLGSNKNLVVDTTPPVLNFSSGLPGEQSKITSTLSISISATDTATYSYKVISGASSGCTGAGYSASINQSTPITTNLTSDVTYPQGEVTVCAKATDAAGNVQTSPAYSSHTWTKDTIAPATFALTAPTGQISSTTPTVTWGTPALDVWGIDLIVSRTSGCSANIVEQYVVSGTTQLAGSAVSKTLTTALSDGTYYICMYTYDVAQNKSTLISGSFEVETDTLHVSWKDNNGIQYGTKSGTGSWSTETVDSGVGTYDSRNSVAVDNSGAPVVGYSVNDGTSTYMRYRKRTGVSTWAAAQTVNSAANSTMTGIGSFNEIAVGGTTTLYSVFFGYDSSAPLQGLIGGTNAGIGAGVLISGTNATTFKDMAIAVGTSGSQYGTVSWWNGTNWILKIANLGAQLVGTPTLPTNCTDAPYVSAFAKNSDTIISMATTCRMSDNTCKAFYGEATYTGTGANFTYSAWTDLGVIKSATCAVSDLTPESRPSVVYDRVNSKVAVAFRDITNNQIKRWTNESGSNATETVLTGSGTVGYPTIAVDKTPSANSNGRSYIVYKDGDSVRFVTNNARTFNTFTGGWTSPATIVTGTTVTGIGNIGITGMKGRGNTTSGQ